MAKSTWRFLFVDVNESIVITEQDTKWITYLAGRFPKGNLKADFIAPDNAAMIKAMYGYPSADWPDIYELIELNKQFGVYVSANPGTSNDVPNYYGGYYQTSLGYKKMYCNTSKEEPNFLTSVRSGEFASFLHVDEDNSKVTTALNEAGSSAVITITGIPAKIMKNTSEIAFDYWNQKKPFRYSLDKNTGLIHPSSNSVKSSDAQAITCGTFKMVTDPSTGNVSYTLNLGANADLDATVKNWNTAADESEYGIPFIDYTKYGSGVYDYSDYYADVTFDTWNNTEDGEASKILNAILNGGVAEDIGTAKVDLSYPEGLAKKVRFLYNVEDITKCWAVQKSPTAQDTTLEFSQVVYDKYTYDESLPYVAASSAEEAFKYVEDEDGVHIATAAEKAKTGDEAPVIKTVASKAMFEKILSASDYSTFANAGEDGFTVVVASGKASTQKVMQWQDADEDEGTAEGWYDITDSYATKRIVLTQDVTNLDTDKEYLHNIYRGITDDNGNSYLDLMTESNTNEDLVLSVNPSYNMFTFEAIEEDEEGEIHS